MTGEQAYNLAVQLRTHLGMGAYVDSLPLADGSWRVVWAGPDLPGSQRALLRHSQNGQAFVGNYLDTYLAVEGVRA